MFQIIPNKKQLPAGAVEACRELYGLYVIKLFFRELLYELLSVLHVDAVGKN